MSIKKAIWLSYDLGLKGDYSGLYAWLDSVKATECGDSCAFFTVSSETDIVEKIKSQIEQNVKLQNTDRLYLIYKDNVSGKLKGNFIHGGRKRAPWEGFATTQVIGEDTAE